MLKAPARQRRGRGGEGVAAAGAALLAGERRPALKEAAAGPAGAPAAAVAGEAGYLWGGASTEAHRGLCGCHASACAGTGCSSGSARCAGCWRAAALMQLTAAAATGCWPPSWMLVFRMCQGRLAALASCWKTLTMQPRTVSVFSCEARERMLKIFLCL